MNQPSQNNSKTELSKLDPGQILKDVHLPNDNALKVINGNCLVPNEFSKVAVTYITSGNGVGEIGTATYYDSGVKQESTVMVNGDQQPSSEITAFTFTNDLSYASLGQKHLRMHDSSGWVGVFFAVDGDTNVPTMDVDRSIKVDILSTDSIKDIALKFRDAVTADASFVASGSSQLILVTHLIQGTRIDAEDVDTEITIQVTSQGQEDKRLNNTYFWIHRPGSKKHHVWYNVASGGTDPNPAGSEGGIEVAIASNESQSEVLSKTIDAINESIYFTAYGDHLFLVVVANEAGLTDDINDGDTGFGHFKTLTYGEDKKIIRTLVLTYNVDNEIVTIDSF